MTYFFLNVFLYADVRARNRSNVHGHIYFLNLNHSHFPQQIYFSNPNHYTFHALLFKSFNDIVSNTSNIFFQTPPTFSPSFRNVQLIIRRVQAFVSCRLPSSLGRQNIASAFSCFLWCYLVSLRSCCLSRLLCL